MTDFQPASFVFCLALFTVHYKRLGNDCWRSNFSPSSLVFWVSSKSGNKRVMEELVGSYGNEVFHGEFKRGWESWEGRQTVIKWGWKYKGTHPLDPSSLADIKLTPNQPGRRVLVAKWCMFHKDKNSHVGIFAVHPYKKKHLFSSLSCVHLFTASWSASWFYDELFFNNKFLSNIVMWRNSDGIK